MPINKCFLSSRLSIYLFRLTVWSESFDNKSDIMLMIAQIIIIIKKSNPIFAGLNKMIILDLSAIITVLMTYAQYDIPCTCIVSTFENTLSLGGK